MVPKVSVFMMTYNHAQYIAQALDSVLAQETDFLVEIVIGEDNSTDGTRAIVSEYAQRYPTRIRALLHQTNIGAHRNQVAVLDACDGEYIAMLEGDDYWIDNRKLAKQVAFLDKNPAYSICFTNIYELSGGIRVASPMNHWIEEKTFTIHDLSEKNFLHTPSVMFRNGLIQKLPIWFNDSPVGDYVLHMLNAKYGLIKYFPEPMAVYRKLSGTWSSMSIAVQYEKFRKVVEFLLKEDFDEKTLNLLKQQRNSLILAYCAILMNNNDYSFLTKLEQDLVGESEFVRKLILTMYPERLRSITSSNTYIISSKLAAIVHRVKSFLRH